jgi:hypothetical protein
MVYQERTFPVDNNEGISEFILLPFSQFSQVNEA